VKTPVRVGVFDTVRLADRAVGTLIAAGFAQEQISVICPQCHGPIREGVRAEEPAGAHTPGAAAAGGAIGAVLGGLTGIAGLASGGAALLVAGPLLGAAAGAVSGGFIGAMLTRGFEPEIADYYDQALQKGKVLVAVEDDDERRLAEAERVLAQAGAEPVSLPAG
jgi:outer membrane lipoprotein SlyB